jgi:poly(A) polymerase
VELESVARRIVERLHDHGFKSYYAGGCVRDMLRGVAPSDYDVATSARPEQVQQLFPHTIAVGAHFGVICVIEQSREFQVATFRDEGIYLDGRHPESVTFSNPEKDAQRRDFTINGMFYDPLQNRIIDFVGGQADLAVRLLRAIGNPAHRFDEDRLRLLRAIRFAAALDFTIEESTWEAIRANATRINSVSPERIRDELVKTLVSANRVRGFDLLDESGLMQAILPEVSALKGCEQPAQFHPEGDVFVHTRKMLELLSPDASVTLVFSALLHDVGKPATFSYDEAEKRIRFSGHDKAGAAMAHRIMERLRFSRAEIDATVEGIENHMVFKDVQHMRVSRLKRFMARPTFADELVLHKVDCQSSHGMLDNYEFLIQKQEEFANEPLIPPPLISGEDLKKLGFKPGPIFRQILDAVQTRQLEGTVNSREDALDLVRREFRPR